MVLVTRPQPQADEWVARLHTLGLRAVALPLLAITAAADPAPVRAAWAGLAGAATGAAPGPAPARPPARPPAHRPAVVMFVSPSTVDRFFALKPADLVWPSGVIAAGTGPGTRRALLAAGVPGAAVLTPPDAGGQFDSEALWAVLRERVQWVGSQVLVVRGEGGRDWLADALRQQGAQVHFVEAYRRTVPVLDAPAQAVLQQALAQPSACCWLFSSSEAVGHLPALAPAANWAAAAALASHPRIAEAARRLGFGRVRQVLPSPEAVTKALREGPAA
ncbi:MAG: uroporphyrinogen-III synthase [Microbacteriaceae bacterium]|nr:uroporphyrinogen-III synthase [Burkholderiaceae bacterium]